MRRTSVILNSAHQKAEMWLLVHRNKVVLLAAAAAGVFVGGRYLVQKLSEQQDGQQSAQLRSLRLKEHYESNRQTCLSAVVGLVPSVRGVVSRHLDAETITSQLKTKPDNKVTLWENLKVVSFSRLVAGVYACSLLVVFLRVQLSVLGGCMFLDLQKSTGELSAPADVQKQYLSTVQYLLQEGLVSLMRVVREAAEGVLLTYSLKHQLTCEGVLQLLSDIRLQTTSHPPHSLGRHRQHASFLVQYLLPKESLLHIGEKVRDSQTDLLLAATRDIIESPDFSSVLDSTVDCAFVHLSRTLLETYHSAAQSSPTLPLARIIPLITDHAQLVFSTQSPGSFAQMLLAVHELQTLSENIYEAFSQSS